MGAEVRFDTIAGGLFHPTRDGREIGVLEGSKDQPFTVLAIAVKGSFIVSVFGDENAKYRSRVTEGQMILYRSDQLPFRAATVSAPPELNPDENAGQLSVYVRIYATGAGQ